MESTIESFGTVSGVLVPLARGTFSVCLFFIFLETTCPLCSKIFLSTDHVSKSWQHFPVGNVQP